MTGCLCNDIKSAPDQSAVPVISIGRSHSKCSRSQDLLPSQPALLHHRNIQAFNRWPEAADPGFKPAMLRYFRTMEHFGLRLTEAFLAAFNMPTHSLHPWLEGTHSAFCRLNYYPPATSYQLSASSADVSAPGGASDCMVHQLSVIQALFAREFAARILKSGSKQASPALPPGHSTQRYAQI